MSHQGQQPNLAGRHRECLALTLKKTILLSLFYLMDVLQTYGFICPSFWSSGLQPYTGQEAYPEQQPTSSPKAGTPFRSSELESSLDLPAWNPQQVLRARTLFKGSGPEAFSGLELSLGLKFSSCPQGPPQVIRARILLRSPELEPSSDPQAQYALQVLKS